MLSAVQELPEVGGKGGPGWGGQVQTNAGHRSIMKHTNTQLCGQPPTVLADPPQQAANPS